MNTFLSGVIEIPSNLLCYIFLEKFGRRWPNGGALLVTAVIELALVPILLLRPDMSELLTALSTLGKGAITFAFGSIYLYTSELFPTPEDVWLPMPSVIFGVLSTLTGSLVLLLPETKGHKIPDTVEEAEQIGRSRKKGRPIPDIDVVIEWNYPKDDVKGSFENKGYDENISSEKTRNLSMEEPNENDSITRL
ncbi:hypothetical protein LSH36_1273g00021 [Paralvinella palmiformis]|uniref:Uncharacterized protein n=1 Tax=Paralvinella palmiformis TaxID=53620 RepID=A0AAD9IU98_9ANNE|nr:hypothetical protein LSH36_1273g00021 [Paralvinella palmiformis]